MVLCVNRLTLRKLLWVVSAFFAMEALLSCKGSDKGGGEAVVEATDTAAITMSYDSAMAVVADTVKPEKRIHVNVEEELQKPEYAGGILPTIYEASPEYARKVLENPVSGLIVVDKRRMKVILYDRYGHEKLSYGMACARNYGTKHKKADWRTPEGYFTVVGIFDSTDWHYTDDWGNTSPSTGAFGPRFIRLSVPQIGIHGTGSPGSIGRRASHGCIRVTNQNIMELVKHVQAGMSVIIVPGPNDQAVNKREGYNTVSFLTGPADDITHPVVPEKPAKDNKTDEAKPDSAKVSADTVAAPAPVTAPSPAETPATPAAPTETPAAPEVPAE